VLSLLTYLCTYIKLSKMNYVYLLAFLMMLANVHHVKYTYLLANSTLYRQYIWPVGPSV